MDIVRILDRDFSELGVSADFIRLRHTNEFRGAGEAELVIPVDSPAAKLVVPDGYVTVPDGTVYRVMSVEHSGAKGRTTVACKGLLSLFEGTVAGEEYGLVGDALALLGVIMRRARGQLPLPITLNTATGAPTVTLRSGRSVILADMLKVCRMGGVGMNLVRDGDSLVFTPLMPRDRRRGTDDPVSVSGRLGTVRSDRIVWDLSGYRNVAVVSGAEKDSGGRYTAVVRADGMEMADGFDDSLYFDRQILVTFSAPLSGYVTVDSNGESVFDEAAYEEAMIAAGAAALGKCRPKLCLYGQVSGDIAPGDIVTVSDPDSGITADALAEKVTTLYENNSVTVTAEMRTMGA